MRKDVGAVGARLYYEDDTIQHAGVVIGLAELQDTVLSSRREVPPDIVTELSVHRITVRLQLPA